MKGDRQREQEDRERAPEAEEKAATGLPEAWRLLAEWPFPSAIEIERRFEELIRARWGGGPGAAPADVFFHGREVLVEVDLPGVERESVQVRIERGELLVEARRAPTPPSQEVKPARLERIRGAIRRRVPLPVGLVASRLEFELEGGVLRVRVLPEEGV